MDMWRNSAMNDLRQCEQKFTYRHIEGLESRALSVPLMRGTWFHALMAAQGLKQGRVQGTLLIDPETIDLGFDQLKEVPTDRLDPATVHQMILDEVWAYVPQGFDEEADALPQQVWDLYQRYMAVWGPTAVGEDVLLVEHQWQREDDESGIAYGGRVDRLVRTTDGIVTIRDHKTTGQRPASEFRLTNAQPHLYGWGMEPLLEQHGIECRALEYDYAITRAPGQVRLTKAGALYKNQALVDEWTLVRGLAEQGADPDAPAFADERERARTEGNAAFFVRDMLPLSPHVIESILTEGVILSERADALTHRRAVRSISRSCEWCEFKALCSAELYGNDATPLREELTHA